MQRPRFRAANGDRAAGTYAQERYDQALRAYRRRMRAYYIGPVAIAFAVYLIAWKIWGLDWLSFFVGAFFGGVIALANWTRDEPPEFIQKWQRGAEGERKTAKAVAPLLKAGWKAKHDVDLGRGNADHLLRSPSGTAYLLETKALSGQISIEYDKLTCRFVDDPLEVRRYDLRDRMESMVSQVNREWSKRTGRPAPEIRPVVVIWGVFPDGEVETGQLRYVAGDRLRSFLADDETRNAQDGARQPRS